MTHTIYLALGTNIGDRLENLKTAIEALVPKITVLTQSSVYETEPWGFADQRAFLNMVISAQTELPPPDLLVWLKELEASLGRTPTFPNGPRLIDLDILFYDEIHINTPPLVIPHPRLHERSFVLVPLADVAPAFIHPLLGLSVTQLLQSVDTSGVRLFAG